VQRRDRGFGLSDDLLIVFRLAELKQARLFLEVARQGVEALKLLFELGFLPHHGLRALRRLPEVRVFGLGCQLGDARLGSIVVKDAPVSA